MLEDAEGLLRRAGPGGELALAGDPADGVAGRGGGHLDLRLLAGCGVGLRNEQRSALVACRERRAQGRGARPRLDAHEQRREGTGRHGGAIAPGRVELPCRDGDGGVGRAHGRHRCCRDGGVVLVADLELGLLVAHGCRQAVHQPPVDGPRPAVVGDDEVAGRRTHGAAQEGTVEVVSARGLQLRRLVAHRPAHLGADLPMDLSIGEGVAGSAQRSLESGRHRPSVSAAVHDLLRRLVGSAPGEQDVGRVGHGPAAVTQGVALRGARPDELVDVAPVEQEALERPRATVGRCLSADEAVLERGAGAAAGVAAVEDDDDVRVRGGHLGDEHGQLLVREVPLPRRAAVVEHQRLVETVRLEVPPLLGRRLLRAVPAVVEERHVTLAGQRQVLAEAGDHRGPGRRVVGEGPDVEGALVAGHASREQGFDGLDVVAAPAQGGHRRGIVVDADEQRVDIALRRRGRGAGVRGGSRWSWWSWSPSPSC